MGTLIATVVVWAVILGALIYARYGGLFSRWRKAVAFKLQESILPSELFGLLLGGNLALLAKDDFNQLASSLSLKRVRGLLLSYWGIETRDDFAWVLQQRLATLGHTTHAERDAFMSLRFGEPSDTPTYAALFDVCRFLSVSAGLIDPGRISIRHLQMLAWDIEQAAYMVRLGYSIGYLSREQAFQTLRILAATARFNYRGWAEFSISALIGIGVRGAVGGIDRLDWFRYARTHAFFEGGRGSAIAHAQSWTSSEKRASGEVQFSISPTAHAL